MANKTEPEVKFLIDMAMIEQDLIMAGAQKKRWGRMERVALREESVSTPLSRLIGDRFAYNKLVAIIDYWGYKKRSTAFLALAAKLWPIGVRHIEALVVPFGAFHEDDVRINAPDLLETWRRYRKAVVKARQQQEAEELSAASQEAPPQTTAPPEVLITTV